jgi:hypothetical protein
LPNVLSFGPSILNGARGERVGYTYRSTRSPFTRERLQVERCKPPSLGRRNLQAAGQMTRFRRFEVCLPGSSTV